ncbi:uncharacterized protein B0H18DRAFT_1189556 [Fomitopsis serialis]|uniref:uncharacterized protein n=1 Tax=Fomitopsis serialis TaxID=139415 RepID=UPI0020087AFC|nr:uncharacterized protein B0H18DRAFT_1189556 [Neoantrodia serialis]KAH9908252.1 hypothetical protein B0H18DRAFT_1189556 [Neoantrodia serialis]
MYSEKSAMPIGITCRMRIVRSRNFNMYLNVRQPPLRSKLPAFLNPFTLLFPRPTPSSVAPAAPLRHRSPSPTASRTKRSSSVPIPPIPPASSPRGELISHRVSSEAFATVMNVIGQRSSGDETGANVWNERRHGRGG